MAMQRLYRFYTGFIHIAVSTANRWRFGLGSIASLFLLTFFAAPVAAGTFTPPEGCTGYMTVQMVGCTVSNHYICTGDAPGDKWRADFAQNGKVFESRINFEAEWMESINYNPSSRQTLELPARDRASFSELVARGIDSYDFSTMGDDGVRENITGTDKLTGKTIVIDGVALKQTEFDAHARLDDGTTKWHSRGNEFIDVEKRIFVSGRGEWEGDDGVVLPYDSTPMAFVFPGEPGFFTSTPIFDCDPVLSQAETPVLISAPQGE